MISGIYYFFTFLAGLFFGSFFNLISDRLVKGGPIVFGRSKCDHCGVFLKPHNLVPLFSFLFQRGRCAYCEKKLSRFYPLSEVLTGIMFVLAAHFSNVFSVYDTKNLIMFLYLAVVFSVYLILFFSDSKYLIIPDRVVYFGIAFVFLIALVGLATDIFTTYKSISTHALGKYLIQAGYLKSQIMWLLQSFGFLIGSTLIIGLFFVSLILLTKGRGMGGGDVKLSLLIGLFNGFPGNVLAIFLGFVIGSLFSLVLITFKRKTMKDTIPFGPFLISGSLISYFWGNQILDWYFHLLG